MWELWKYPWKEVEGICLCAASRACREDGKPKTGLSPASHLFASQLFRLEKIFRIMDCDVPPALPRPPSQKLMKRKAQLLRQEQREIQELRRT